MRFYEHGSLLADVATAKPDVKGGAGRVGRHVKTL